MGGLVDDDRVVRYADRDTVRSETARLANGPTEDGSIELIQPSVCYKLSWSELTTARNRLPMSVRRGRGPRTRRRLQTRRGAITLIKETTTNGSGKALACGSFDEDDDHFIKRCYDVIPGLLWRGPRISM